MKHVKIKKTTAQTTPDVIADLSIRCQMNKSQSISLPINTDNVNQNQCVKFI